MTSRERVQIAFQRKEPDRVPAFASFVPEVATRLCAEMGILDMQDMSAALGNDMLLASAGIGNSYYGPAEEYVCDWGCKWKYIENESGRYTCIVEHPLEKDEDGSLLEAYKIPDPEGEKALGPLKDLVARYGSTHFIGYAIACSIFEASWYLRGLESMITDMAINPEYAEALMDKVMEFPLKAGLKGIEAGADMLWLGDDVGMQNGMMMSPAMWRRFLKPRMAKLIGAFKAKKPDITVAYHSCGYIIPIIGDLIEIGLDVLNPIQPKAMDPAEVKRLFGDRLSFWGSIDLQETLPKGTRQDIFNEVKLRMETIGCGGGLLIGPAHNVQADTSNANIHAFFDAARELGNYR
jgi:uroporphyrinogen decarboxylase